MCVESVRGLKRKSMKYGLGKRLDLLSDGFHSSGGVSGFPSNPITTVKCDLGSWPYAAHHETPWAFHISSGPDTNRGAPGILSLQPAAAMGVFRTVEGIKFSKRAPIPPGFCTERNRIGFRENGDQATAHWTKNDWFSIKREIIIYDHHPYGKVGSKKMIYPGFDKKERSFNFWSDNFPGNKIVRYIFGIRDFRLRQ